MPNGIVLEQFWSRKGIEKVIITKLYNYFNFFVWGMTSVEFVPSWHNQLLEKIEIETEVMTSCLKVSSN